MEMYEAGWESSLSCKSVRKWSIDPSAEDGGIMGTESWKRRENLNVQSTANSSTATHRELQQVASPSSHGMDYET